MIEEPLQAGVELVVLDGIVEDVVDDVVEDVVFKEHGCDVLDPHCNATFYLP